MTDEKKKAKLLKSSRKFYNETNEFPINNHILRECLTFATTFYCIPVIAKLLEMYPNIDCSLASFLAANRGDYEMISYFVQSGKRSTFDVTVDIICAAENDHMTVAKKLQPHGIFAVSPSIILYYKLKEKIMNSKKGAFFANKKRLLVELDLETDEDDN
eukprot:Awhi_evm1s9533